METVVIAVHIIAAVAVVALVLLQQGKGAEMGASFGSGSANTLFGPQGAGTVFSRATAILVAVFFITSFALAIIAKNKLTGSLDEGVPSTEVLQTQAPDTDVPAADAVTPAAENDIPQK
jgi:preprotein translocase subunit SecG